MGEKKMDEADFRRIYERRTDGLREVDISRLKREAARARDMEARYRGALLRIQGLDADDQTRTIADEALEAAS